MAENLLRTLAEDLLNLEVNTIIKAEMSAVKFPASRRQALYDLARLYHDELLQFQLREPVYWEFAGMRSFGELRDRAKSAMLKYGERLGHASSQESRGIFERIKMFERIQDQSSQIVGMFKLLEQQVADKTRKRVPGYLPAPAPSEAGGKKAGRAEAHSDSERWNNDIDRNRMNQIADLELSPDQVVMIRKAWEIGTERIVLQTQIQLDGDVTTRISESFADNPVQIILKIHNESVSIVTGFWSTLVRTFGDIFGKSLGSLLGK